MGYSKFLVNQGRNKQAMEVLHTFEKKHPENADQIAKFREKILKPVK